ELLIREFFDTTINGHDLTAFPRFCGPGYIWHGSGNDIVGRDAFAKLVSSFLHSFPDLHAQILDVVAEADCAAVRYQQIATHTRTYAGIAPTGRVLRWSG